MVPRGARQSRNFVERCHTEIFPADAGAGDEELAAAALSELFVEEAQATAKAMASGDPHSPWNRVDGWRLNLGSHHELVLAEGGRSHRVAVHFTATGLKFSVGEREYALTGRDEDGVLRVTLGDASFRIRAVRDGLDWHLFRDGKHHVLTLQSVQTSPAPDAIIGTLAAPMPGKVLQVLVEAGATVTKGTPLVILEAMKMEHTIAAPHDGRVAEIHFKAGEQVSEGAELLRLESP